MKIDLMSEFDFEIEKEDETEAEEEQEQETPKQEGTRQQQDDYDRSIPLSQRIDQEISQIMFASGLMGDYNLASATYLAELLKEELDQGSEGEHLGRKFDENGWTFPLLWKAVFEKARKELNSTSAGLPDKIVMGWVRHFIVDEKPNKTEAPKSKASSAPKNSKSEKPKTVQPQKQQPQKDHQQLFLDLESL